MTLRIHRHVLDRVRDHARRGAPHEVVGLLGADGDGAVVAAIEAINEHAQPRVGYRVSRASYERAKALLAALDLSLVGIYHSHPRSGAAYSERDRRNAKAGWSYLIVGGVGFCEARVWRVRGDWARMEEEMVV